MPENERKPPEKAYEKAAGMIRSSRRCVAFTGAGISVESGIPPFRGEGGLWNKYDPATFDIRYFNENTHEAWNTSRKIFYELFGKVKPGQPVVGAVGLESLGAIKAVITQNVDNLHYDAGSRNVLEFHGSLKRLICLKCSRIHRADQTDLTVLPPLCGTCGGVLKPDVVFFGEAIPEDTGAAAFAEAFRADCFLLIGTTGTVAPANMIPQKAKMNGAGIIEINPAPSEYTGTITDIFLKERAAAAVKRLVAHLEP